MEYPLISYIYNLKLKPICTFHFHQPYSRFQEKGRRKTRSLLGTFPLPWNQNCPVRCLIIARTRPIKIKIPNNKR